MTTGLDLLETDAEGAVRVGGTPVTLDALVAAFPRAAACQCLVSLVELRGFEPLTFSLRTRRATNCATAPSEEKR